MIPLQVLLIEDSLDDAALVVRELSQAGYAVVSERVATPKDLALALKRHRWDIAIADYTMPGFDGTAALSLVKEHDSDLPFIFVSGTIGEEAAVAAMQIGAQDYVSKANFSRLVPAVQRQLQKAAERLARTRAGTELLHHSYRDMQTDLPNPFLLHDRLQQALRAAQRARRSLALIILDLDGLKANAVNSSLGQEAIDLVVEALTGRLRALLREVDTVARLGADQFALMLPETGSDGAVRTARKVLEDLTHAFTVEGRPFLVAGWLGIAVFPEHALHADELLQKAGQAVHRAKSDGIGHVVSSPDRGEDARGRRALIGELREGLETHQFSSDYEPIVLLDTGRVLSVEALARWNHPTQGRLRPSEFLDLVDQAWLIDSMTLMMIDQALAEWTPREGLPGVSVAVNLPWRSLRDPDLPDRVADALRRHGSAPSALVLQIAENILRQGTRRTLSCLARLHEMGVTLAVCGFGRSESATSYLRHLPITRLKLHHALVNGVTAKDDANLEFAIDLAHRLNLIVVAEGVESTAARDRLLELTCDAAQGLAIAKPGPVTDIRRWVARRNAAHLP
jgi:diguanylate cyclase (GGDEF)-like protein